MNGRRDARHALEHIEVITPEIPRFKELGVSSIQPYHMVLILRESHTTRVSESIRIFIRMPFY
ncbi:hypothetical protein HRF87_13415 [Bacillus sp. CRN 9]|nr:hypothetical protein [Bacillus sp. CRN 9]